jgi:AhpD family alkylhydroperoxidase
MPTPDTDAASEARSLAENFYGLVPNQIKVLNEHNPAAAKMYVATMDLIEGGVLEPDEREAVILAISRYNDCHYCTSTHAMLARRAGLSKEAVDAINRGGLPTEERPRALVQAARLLLDKRGRLDDEDLDRLEADGVGRGELYEINALIGLKIFSNYVNHVAQTEVDPEIDEMHPDT